MSFLPGKARALHQQPLAAEFWYQEPEGVTEKLMWEVKFREPVHDPCCGEGHIPLVAHRFGYQATGSDLIDRGFGVGGVDFFADMTPRVSLVFNPPSGRNQDPTLSTRFTLHRSDEALVRSEIEAVGFKLIGHGDFLRVPGDARDAHSHSSAQPVDIYMLKFRKPG
jgi:hypothetical protein